MNEQFLKQEKSFGLKQNQHQLLSLAMQQAFTVLQMPVLELSDWLKIQIEQNPVLEYAENLENQEAPFTETPEIKEIDFDKPHFDILEGLDDIFEESAFSEEKDWSKAQEEKRLKDWSENQLPTRVSQFEYLMGQAKEAFHTAEELSRAEAIIGNLDERGFLENAHDLDEKILEKIQTFDPPGIAARNLQESLLIQLRLQNKEHSLAYHIIESYYQDLIQNRIPYLRKKLKCSPEDLSAAIQRDIAHLDVHPGYRFHIEPFQSIIPDVVIKKEEQKWTIDIVQDLLPQFKISPTCFNAFVYDELGLKEKQYIRRHVAAGKWLHRIIHRRHHTLKNITLQILKKQTHFFDGDKKKLTPMTLAEISHELSLHESTIARAISGKYLACPQGTFPLRSFFTSAITTPSGEQVSNFTIKQILSKLIQQEDKYRPLSDEALSTEIKKLGLPCARRTITKYRKALKIGPASHRRRYLSSGNTQ